MSTLTFFFLGRSAATLTLKTVRTSESLLSYIDIRPAVAIIIFWGVFHKTQRARRFVRALAASCVDVHMPSQGIIEPAQITLGEMSANTTDPDEARADGKTSIRFSDLPSIAACAGTVHNTFALGIVYIYYNTAHSAPPTTKWNHRVGIIKEEHYYSSPCIAIGKGIFENGKEEEEEKPTTAAVAEAAPLSI